MIALPLLPLALLVGASPAPLTMAVQDVRAAYGPLWPDHPSLVYYPPDDVIFFRYRLTGVTLTAKRSPDLDETLELVDGAGKVVLSRHERNARGELYLGGDTLHWYSTLLLTKPVPPGAYTFRAALKNNLTGEVVRFERQVRLAPVAFAVQSIRFYRHRGANVLAPPEGRVGERLEVYVHVIGATPGPAGTDANGTLEVLDDTTGAVLKREGSVIKDAVPPPPGAPSDPSTTVYVGGELPLTAAGDFRLRFTVTDRVANKTLRCETRIRVTPP
jgi:hypothetical protein